MDINYQYLLPEEIKSNTNKYWYLKNEWGNRYTKINPLDLSYILGKNDCSTILIKKGAIINKSGFIHIIKELKDINLVKFWIDKCKFNLQGILTEINNLEIIDSKIEGIIEFLRGKNATFEKENERYNFAFKAVLHEDFDRLKFLLKHEFGNSNDVKIRTNEKYIDKLLLKRKNLLHFAILNNQKNLKIIEYLSLFKNSCLLCKYKLSSKKDLGINGLIRKRVTDPAFKNNKYKELTTKISEFYNDSFLKKNNISKSIFVYNTER